jgi:hypothetical protein
MKYYREDLKSDQAKMIAAFKEKTDAWIANIKDALKIKTACQEVTRANPEKIEPNLVEVETVVEQHDIPNEEVEVHSQRTEARQQPPKKIQRRSPIQERCSLWRSIERSRRKTPQ